MSLEATMPIMIAQTVSMFIVIAVGIVLFKTKMIDNEGSLQMANVCNYVAMPAVIAGSLAVSFDREKLALGLVCALASVVLTMAGAGVAYLVWGKRQRVAQLGITVSNMGFIAIPLVRAAVGEEYVFYASMCIAAQVLLIWTYGVWLVTQDRSCISLKRVVVNPGILAVFAGMIVFLFSVDLRGVPEKTLGLMGDITTGLGMLILGTYLAQTDVRSVMRSKSLYVANLIRLIVVPAIMIALMLPLPIDTEVKAVILMAASAPCGTMAAMLPQMFGGDYRFGAGLVSSSTLLSLVTMPLMLWIALQLF